MPPATSTAPVATEALAELLVGGRVLVLTGAGISTDSGIPDYRGPDGRERHASPMTYDRFVGSEADRRRYWARSHLGWRRFAAAAPNASHLAVSALQQAGLVTGVVTQNVDGLHSAAGSVDVIDLHGRLDTVVCLGCGQRRPRFELAMRLDAVNPGVRDAAVPDAQRPDGDVTLDERVSREFRVVACRGCEGILKPDVVFFGEAVPRERFARSLARLDDASALLVLGSSLTVGSGYRFVTAARRRGLPVAIVTRGVTRGDPHATLKLDAELAPTLSAVRRQLV
jgi:NAD-dependent SIR2 family protein deacetylase